MIYWKLIVTDQSYEVSSHDKKFVPCPIRFNNENKSVREYLQVKMFAVAGYHTVICNAFILFCIS